MSDHSINHPDVVAAIRGTLVKRGFEQQRLEDGTQEVMTLTLAHQKKLGIGDPGVPKTKAMATRIASNHAIDEGRDEVAQRNRDDKKQYPQAHALPRERTGEDALNAHIDHGRRVQQLVGMVKDGTISAGQLEALEGIAAGEKRAKIAEELGTKPKALDYQVNSARQKIVTRFGIAAASLLTMNVVWNQVIADRWIKRHSVDAVGTMATIRQDDGHVNETAEHEAAKLRESGIAKCAKQDWSGCLRDLNLAYDLDPQGNLDPAVQKARLDMMNAHREFDGNESKPPIYYGPGPKRK